MLLGVRQGKVLSPLLFSRIFRRKLRLMDWWTRSGGRASGVVNNLRKFRFPLKTISLINRFASYTHTLLLRLFQQRVASWPSDDLDIQHCSSTICVKVLITFSLVDIFTSYSHTMLLWSRPLHWYATVWPSNYRACILLRNIHLC